MFQLTLSEMGVAGGTIDLVTPQENWDVSSSFDVPPGCTEVHGTEVGVLVSGDTLYRETSYSVLLPYDSGLIPRIMGHVRSISCNGIDPWDYLRMHVSVSSNSKIFELSFKWFLACFV